MGLCRRYTLTLVREDVTDDGCVVKELPQILCRFKQSELELTYLNKSIGDICMTEMVLDQLVGSMKNELRHPNSAIININNKQQETDEEKPEPTITPLWPSSNN